MRPVEAERHGTMAEERSAIRIDGSTGEGGGQIVRSALALSILTERPLHLVHIRSGRKRPGLLHQHLTAVKAAATICGADVRGAALGSRELEFRPGPVRPGRYTFSIPTAGAVVG